MGAAMYALQVLALLFVAVIGAAVMLTAALYVVDSTQAGDAIRKFGEVGLQAAIGTA